MQRIALAVLAGLLLGCAVVGRVCLELYELRQLCALRERVLPVPPNARNALGSTSSVEEMNTNDAETLYYPSKQNVWTNAAGIARFKAASFIPPRGPGGGMLHVKRIVAHASLNLTVATATTLGMDRYRAFRTVDVSLVGSPVKPFENISGEALRVINYAQEGARGTLEMQDIAASTATHNFTATIPLSHNFAYDPDDTAVPSEFLDEIAIGMADGANMSLGTSVVTVNSGFYYLIAECYETMSIVLPSLSCWRQSEGIAVSQVDYEVDTGGRLKDMLFYIPGLNGGQTLANLSKAGILFSQDQKLLKDPDFKQIYGRARQVAANLFSTTGNPVHTDPFCSADNGTLRAIAVKLTTGSKVTDGKERAKEVLKLELTANLPAVGRVLARFTTPKSDAQRAIIERTQAGNGNMWYVKTRDKSRRPASAWPEAMRNYLPEKWGKAR